MKLILVVATALLVFANLGVEGQSSEDTLTVVSAAKIIPLFQSPSGSSEEEEDEEEEGEKVPCTTNDAEGDVIRNRNGLIDSRYRWRFFDVFIDNSYSDRDRNIIISAMGNLAGAVPCVTFRVYNRGFTPSGDYLHIVNKGGCWSQLGRRGGRQELSLQNPGCVYVGTVMHEMIHALGFTHEQNRADRDSYVNILTGNIQPGMEHNFRRVDSQFNNFGVPYNFQSIMHYGPYDFSTNRKPTITRKNGSTAGIGSAGVLQSTDIQRLRNMYRCY